jgi:hypothetical protein
MHVPFSLCRIMMSGLLLRTVLSVCTCIIIIIIIIIIITITIRCYLCGAVSVTGRLFVDSAH